MVSVNVHKAKTELSRLLRRVAQGEEVVIARAGKPIARLVPISVRPASRLGLDTSDWDIPKDFDDPLPDELTEEFWNQG